MKQYLRPERTSFNKHSIGQHFVGFFNRIELPFLLILCLIFIYLSKSNHAITSNLSYATFRVMNPVVNVISYPFKTTVSLIFNFQELVSAKKQNRQLKKENGQLKKAITESIYIKNENKELKNILKFLIPKGMNYSMVQITGRSYGMFNHNFTVKYDDDINIKDGSVAIYEKSVVGRIVNPVKGNSKVMLLTDSKSRLPVISVNSRDRGILSGSNSDIMEMKYLSKNHAVAEGELIYTSSDGGQIPPGILAGIVVKVESGRVFVKIAEDINNIDRLTILQY